MWLKSILKVTDMSKFHPGQKVYCSYYTRDLDTLKEVTINKLDPDCIAFIDGSTIGTCYLHATKLEAAIATINDLEEEIVNLNKSLERMEARRVLAISALDRCKKQMKELI